MCVPDLGDSCSSVVSSLAHDTPMQTLSWCEELLGSPPGQATSSPSPLSHEPAALGLICVPRRLDPGPHDFAVLGDPSPRARERVTLLVDSVLQAIDLLLGECERFHERVGHGVLIAQAPLTMVEHSAG